ncbi:MAG: hypothetical protein AVDCRST_MAG96-3234 [uncultured Segetibacter sp.]|uniref:Uncharacterized protein n=1 Tax=uncultured Segetibacter sp. TaxID=481133 RepID=A0A6J4TLF2_9BACT|nr:MAG: hypothetical protein AVDCRST_MAG96-3234 [uncultured Segetibacter sp.]
MHRFYWSLPIGISKTLRISLGNAVLMDHLFIHRALPLVFTVFDLAAQDVLQTAGAANISIANYYKMCFWYHMFCNNRLKNPIIM